MISTVLSYYILDANRDLEEILQGGWKANMTWSTSNGFPNPLAHENLPSWCLSPTHMSSNKLLFIWVLTSVISNNQKKKVLFLISQEDNSSSPVKNPQGTHPCPVQELDFQRKLVFVKGYWRSEWQPLKVALGPWWTQTWAHLYSITQYLLMSLITVTLSGPKFKLQQKSGPY